MANNDKIVRNKMWPSQVVASKLYNFANIFLIVALVIGVISTGMVVWMGNVKEQYLRLELGKSAKEANDALNAAALLKVKSDELESSNLKLEQAIAPRSLSSADSRIITAAMRSFSGMKVKFFVYGWDVEARLLSAQIAEALRSAGLRVLGTDTASNMLGLDGDNMFSGVKVWTGIGTIPARSKLISTLNDVHVNAEEFNEQLSGEGYIIVFVGLKPLPPPHS